LQNYNIFAKFFGKNILKIITSVPGTFVFSTEIQYSIDDIEDRESSFLAADKSYTPKTLKQVRISIPYFLKLILKILF
jgi:hypothetical protein